MGTRNLTMVISKGETKVAVKHRKTYFLIDLPETTQFIKDFDFVEEEN